MTNQQSIIASTKAIGRFQESWTGIEPDGRCCGTDPVCRCAPCPSRDSAGIEPVVGRGESPGRPWIGTPIGGVERPPAITDADERPSRVVGGGAVPSIRGID